jgi:beta-glucanase (GH16 family)
MELAPHLTLGPDGTGSFVFHADQFPNGPINLRLFATDGGSNQDYCELQLFNRGGVAWKQGIPATAPAAAQGMTATFTDEFSGPLSISRDKSGTYWTHWGGGDGSAWAFGENEGSSSPFSLVKGATKSFLRIHAAKPDGVHGITGSLTTNHATGKAPCYIECRFLAQNAKGTWPGFWMTAKHAADLGTNKGACDEIDAIEAYGTNSTSGGIWTAYHATTHLWGQPDPVWIKDKAKGPDGNPYAAHRMVPSMLMGGKTAWSTTFHTYGVLITPTVTAYYLDNIEVLRHPSGEVSASEPFSVIVNLAIGGGGWNADLQRYGNQSDMWIDYLRIFQGGETAH